MLRGLAALALGGPVLMLAAYAEAHPGQLAFASSGNAGAAHLAGELFKQVAGVDLMHGPYRGAAPALTGLISD
jgi:tripartite-type tricarboxylate transporter receptor subunit TctC